MLIWISEVIKNTVLYYKYIKKKKKINFKKEQNAHAN